MKIDRYHANFLHQFPVGNPDARPFVMAGLGWNTYRGKGAGTIDTKSFFSFALGGGIKYFFTDFFGLRGDASWSPALLSVSGSHFWCAIGGQGTECLIKLKASLHHQMDLTGGLIFRF